MTNNMQKTTIKFKILNTPFQMKSFIHLINDYFQILEILEAKYNYCITDSKKFDILLIPPALKYEKVNQKDMNLIKRHYLAGKDIYAFCGGVSKILDIKILSKKTVTTHYMFFEEYSQRFPDVKIDCHRLYIKNKNVYTFGGINSHIDMLLLLLKKTEGYQFANTFNKFIVGHGIRTHQINYLKHDNTIFKYFKKLSLPFSIKDVALQHKMSTRTFQRYCMKEYKNDFRSLYNEYRLKLAIELLEKHQTIDSISLKTGYSDTVSFIKFFKKQTKMTPTEYKRLIL